MPRHASVARLHRRPSLTVDRDDDPLRATAETYARNLFVSTRLRRMERVTLRVFEDAELAQEWARTSTCARCGDDELQGDHVRHHLRRWLAANGAPVRVPAPGEPVRRNLRFAGAQLGLSRDELAVLQFLVALHRSDRLGEVAQALGDLSTPDALKAIAAATRLGYARVAACLAREARLLRTGLVTVDSDKQLLAYRLGVNAALLDVLFLPRLDREAFLRAFLEPAAASTLGREDFPDAPAVETASALLASSARAGARGVNVLLHGPTGVGKTELARLLGQELGLEVLAVGRADAAGASATPHERLASLRLALQLAPRGRSLLVFDELEDLFRWELDLATPSRAAPQMSKQWFGALLEENEVPVVWCTNRIQGIDPAFLRRFTFAIELTAPGARQRAKVLARHLGPESPLAPAEVDAVARRFAASPAQLATAVRAARLVAPGGVPDRATLERLLAPIHKALTGEDAALRPVFDPAGYRLDAVSCAEDLGALAGEVSRFVPGPGPGLSLCLYGAPGTGKSEFVKYLAWRCGRPLVARRVSDLVSPWVGQTERNVAAAFEEARQDGAVLLFDEADSFLRDRRGAVRSWEVTEVNEFLQQLESFPGIVACTTNLLGELDPAALRRFVFKIEFRFLRPEQAAALFAASFPWAAAELAGVARELGRLGRLAPGDFAAVSRRVRAVRARPDATALVRMLADEVALKDAGPRAIGF